MDAQRESQSRCRFVARDYGECESDDEMEDAVTRSTPVESVEFVCDHAGFMVDDAMDGSGAGSGADVAVGGKSPHFQPIPTPVPVPTRDLASRTPLTTRGAAITFHSLDHAFPLATKGTAVDDPGHSKTHSVFSLQATSNTARESESERFPPQFVGPDVPSAAATTTTTTTNASASALALAPANTTGLLLSEELTKPLERSHVSFKRERDEDQDRHSPFGPVPSGLAREGPYCYSASRAEMDEMDRMRWTFQQQGLKRMMTLEQREKEWGSLQLRDNRLAFQHGERYATTMAEKKFYNELCRRGNSEEYCKRRRLELERVIDEFNREEAKHRQALSLAYLEKNSIFCSFPVLGNRFILIRLLGKGGNGEVWDIVDYADKKRRCALKLSVLQAHARREHYTHQRLHHHNIVGVGNDVFTIEYQQQQYTAFTVDTVDSDLQQLIEVCERYDEEAALKVLYQLLHALSYLHDNMKIAHYDIKPTNILIGNDESVKLTDFDLARDVNDPIRSSTVGTLRYLPPECFRPNFGGTAEKADIWMVGIVFCMMLCGKHPIVPEKASKEEAAAILASFNGRLQFSRTLSEISRWIIHSCLSPDPRCRPSASQLFQALRNAAQA